MLKLEQLNVKQNILLIEEYEVQVPEMVNGVHQSPEEINRLKQARRFRIGKVIKQASIDEDILSSISIKGKDNEIIKDFIGLDIIYTAEAVEPIDIPVENTTRLVAINARYLFGTLNETTE